MDKKEMFEMTLTIAVPAIILLITWVAKYFAALLEAKVVQIKETTKNDKIKAAIDIVAEDAVDIVMALNQTLVDGLKSASADGKLSVEDAKDIKNKALQMLITNLSEDIRDTLKLVYNDIDAYLENVVEKTVAKVKISKIKKNIRVRR